MFLDTKLSVRYLASWRSLRLKKHYSLAEPAFPHRKASQRTLRFPQCLPEPTYRTKLEITKNMEIALGVLPYQAGLEKYFRRSYSLNADVKLVKLRSWNEPRGSTFATG